MVTANHRRWASGLQVSSPLMSVYSPRSFKMKVLICSSNISNFSDFLFLSLITVVLLPWLFLPVVSGELFYFLRLTQETGATSSGAGTLSFESLHTVAQWLLLNHCYVESFTIDVMSFLWQSWLRVATGTVITMFCAGPASVKITRIQH